MKKSFLIYTIGWGAVLALFNIFVFVTPSEINGVNKFDGLFWFSYALITIFFIAQLLCTYFMFKTDSLNKVFYSIPLYTVSLISLIVMLIVGGFCMAIVQIPNWIGVILCCIALVFNVLAYTKSILAVELLSSDDKEIKEKTFYVKLLTADAKALMEKAQGEELKKLTFKIYEEIRYSEPMSVSELSSLENNIKTQFESFAKYVESNDVENAKSSFVELNSLIAERNAKCKILR